jgi:hypothetical protein
MYASLISNVFLKIFLHTIVLVPATSKAYDRCISLFLFYIENVNNTENGTTESDTRTPIKATPEEWKKNIRKKLPMSGKEYISQREKSARKSS